ncbi:hypothetical protein V8C86DRAFT_2524301 [Haematococcus lacustris]
MALLPAACMPQLTARSRPREVSTSAKLSGRSSQWVMGRHTSPSTPLRFLHTPCTACSSCTSRCRAMRHSPPAITCAMVPLAASELRPAPASSDTTATVSAQTRRLGARAGAGAGVGRGGAASAAASLALSSTWGLAAAGGGAAAMGGLACCCCCWGAARRSGTASTICPSGHSSNGNWASSSWRYWRYVPLTPPSTALEIMPFIMRFMEGDHWQQKETCRKLLVRLSASMVARKYRSNLSP